MNSHTKPKIAIIGAGAIGSLIGGILARNGEQITLVAKKPHAHAINQNGLIVEGAAGTFTVQVKAVEKLDFNPDIVFISVKTQDVEQTCREIQPFVNDIPVVMTQNGVISSETAGAILGKTNIVSCILLLNAQFMTPGRVTYVNKKPSVVGEAFTENKERTKHIQSLLNMISHTELSDNIIGAQWSKLFINAMGNSLDGMTGLSIGEYVKYPVVRRIGVLILKEALRLVDKAEIKMEPLPGMPVSFFKLLIRTPTPLATLLLKYLLQSKDNNEIITSTLQSLRKGKKTEIDYLNGEFVRLANRLGVPAPFNAKVVELIHRIEETQTFYTPAELADLFSPL